MYSFNALFVKQIKFGLGFSFRSHELSGRKLVGLLIITACWAFNVDRYQPNFQPSSSPPAPVEVYATLALAESISENLLLITQASQSEIKT